MSIRSHYTVPSPSASKVSFATIFIVVLSLFHSSIDSSLPFITTINAFTTISTLPTSWTSSAYKTQMSPPIRSKLHTIALDVETDVITSTLQGQQQIEDEMVVTVPAPSSPTMIDLTGIAFSGLKGQALSLHTFPKANEIRSIIPADCFESDTMKSLSCLAISTIGTAACTGTGLAMLSTLNPANPLTWPIWSIYSVVTGTVAMGLWVLAHECGHGAFSKNKALQDTVGYIIHSIMLVPYFSWQRSHAVHHQYTNHMELGETHVPESNGESLDRRNSFINVFGKERGIQAWGALQSFLHLVVGWPAYLLVGATGGPARGMTNHFYPEPLTTPDQPKRELFPGNWKSKVYQSDIGIAATVAAVIAWSICNGPAQVMALYGGPLIIVNAWLVLYTWLQHTDTDVPHFSSDDHTFVKGALHTIDRPYDKLDPYGIIDFLHHKIGTTHVAHHFDSTIPHYKAQIATDAIKSHFPEYYLYDPTPIPQALWRIAKGCTSVVQRGDKWVWNNAGIEDRIECN